MAIFHFNDIVSFNCAFHCSSDEKGVSDKRSNSNHQMFSAGGKGGVAGHKTKWYVYV